MSVVNEIDHGMHPEEAAEKYNTSRTNVIKWVKEKSKLVTAATSEHKSFLKIRPSRKYKELYKELEVQFKAARAKV